MTKTIFQPPSIAGYLYYVRLRTEFGLMYKLGFTTLPSVQARLAFAGSGDDKLIDKVLFFHDFENAWKIEQDLHLIFNQDKLFPCDASILMPLFQNGQSELYGVDILELDDSYSVQQLENVQDNIVLTNITYNGTKNHDEVRSEINANRIEQRLRKTRREKSKEDAALYRPGIFVRSMIFIYKPFAKPIYQGLEHLVNFFAMKKSSKPLYRAEYKEELIGMLHDILRLERKKKLTELNMENEIETYLPFER